MTDQQRLDQQLRFAIIARKNAQTRHTTNHAGLSNSHPSCPTYTTWGIGYEKLIDRYHYELMRSRP